MMEVTVAELQQSHATSAQFEYVLATSAEAVHRNLIML